MRIKRVLSGVAALALASIGVLATTSGAQAAEIDDTSRVEGPIVVTWYSSPAQGAWLFNYFVNGTFVRDDYPTMVTSSPPWLTDMNDPNWMEAASGADRGSFPALGAEPGKIRFESGTAKGKCIGLQATKPVVVNCTSGADFTALQKGAGIIFRSTTGHYLQIDPFNALKTTDVVDTDLFNGNLMTPVKRTVADVAAQLDRVEDDSAFVSGTGEPGATITIKDPNGTPYTTTVTQDGTWGPVEIPGLPEGTSTLPVTQTVDGQAAGETSVDVTIEAPEPVIPVVAGPDTADVKQKQSVEIDVLANDSGQGPLKIAGVVQPDHGSITIVDGKIVYTADDTFQGTDSFTYVVEDAAGNTAVGTVTVTVAAEAAVPVMAPGFALAGLALAGVGAGLRRRHLARA